MLLTMLPVTAMAANAYYINGKTVHYDDFASSPDECWAYANNVYNKIWGQWFSNSFGDVNNSLRELSDSQLTLTSAHLKAYVSNAKLGSVIRICNSEYLHGTDGWGHSQIIVQKDNNGFTVFEGGLSASPYCREKYYTWSSYLNEYSYAYIKYIKWPGAQAYVDSHTCNRGSYQYYEAEHPHYKVYKCSICGKAWRDTSAPTALATCDDCRPGKPALLNMQSSYKAGESVTFTWDSTSNTTHYNLWLARSIGNDKWENVEQVFYADNGMTRTFEAGEYRVQLLSYNSDLWETDHSDWVHTWSDDYFFTVEEPVLDSGTCGDNGSNVTWKLTEDGILTISGTGAMIDYGDDKSYRKTPWRDYFIESVRIDEGVTSIGGWAFTNCVLTSVMIPDSVTSIACGAFSECRSLASVTIPDSVTSIGGYAFRGCTGLTSVTIPDSVTSIDGYAFSGCDSLTDVYYAGTAADWAKISISSGNEDLLAAALHCKPTPLTAPSVTGGNDSQGRPTLKWNAVSGAAKYEVYRARSMNGDYIKYSTVTGTSYTNISYIENGNTYYYKVRALKSDGTAGAWSSVVSVTYKQTLSAPTVTGGNDAQGRPTLKWNAVSGAAKYEVYRARSLNGDYIKYSTVTGTSYTNISYIENGNTYYYKVRALDANGTAGAWSSIVAVTYKQTLSAPAVTGGNDSQGRPTLTWKAVTGAAKYEVYRARSRSGEYIKYSTVTGTSYTNTSYIEDGNTYYYKVRALKSDGTAGAWSSIVSVTYRAASTGTLSAPAVTGGNDAQGRPTLTWKAVTGAAKYEVYRARSKDGDYIKYSTVTGTSYTNTSYIENGNTYYYKVRALKSDGTAGAWSSIVSVTYKQTLSAPAVTGGNDSQGRPTLKWNAVTGAAKYEVYRARSKDGDYIKYSTVTGTSYTNTSYIENGNTYYYKVRALKSDGTAGAWSSIVSVTYRKPAAATVASGKCGDSAKWKLDAEGTLTISGTGRMYDYEWPADRGGTTPPWLANKYRDSIRALRVEQGITYIGRCAFDSCGNLSDVTLPTSLRIIGPWAFNDCTALRSIQLPEGLTTIKEDAFKAAGLVSITFPSTLRELRNCAFMNCEKLQSLRLPEGLTTIGVWAFYCNPNISSIYIPASVTTIGEEAFIYYNNLATVRYGGSQSQWSAVSVGANAFPDGVRYVYNVN